MVPNIWATHKAIGKPNAYDGPDLVERLALVNKIPDLPSNDSGFETEKDLVAGRVHQLVPWRGMLRPSWPLRSLWPLLS